MFDDQYILVNYSPLKKINWKGSWAKLIYAQTFGKKLKPPVTTPEVFAELNSAQVFFSILNWRSTGPNIGNTQITLFFAVLLLQFTGLC